MTEQLTAESELGKKLEAIIKNKISTFGLEDDLDDVSQYIVVMVSNNKPVNELTTELCGIFGEKFTDDFGRWVYAELQKLQHGESDTTAKEESGFGGYVDNTRPDATNRGPFKKNNNNNKNGISKGGSRRLGGHSIGGGSKGDRRTNNNNNLQQQLQQDVMMGNDNDDISARGDFNNLELGDRQQQQRKERCRHWPNCNYPNCRFPHPTRPCNSYPNCSYPKGTCPFLHIGEDPLPGTNGVFIPPTGQVDLKNPLGGGWVNGIPVPPQSHPQFAQSKRKHHQNKRNQQQPPDPALMACKYSDKCAVPQCPFGHPTPSNPEAKIRIFEWCPQGVENCQDPTCEYAHKSGSLVRAPEPIPDRVLTQCKYNERCTNPKCRYRHARNPTLCRNGVDCERLDCLFTHPFKEQCKFQINCRNPQCLYQHPPEREEAMKAGGVANTWVNPNLNGGGQNSEGNTSDRQFAADEASEKMVISSEV